MLGLRFHQRDLRVVRECDEDGGVSTTTFSGPPARQLINSQVVSPSYAPGVFVGVRPRRLF
jgi:hypothetical protein